MMMMMSPRAKARARKAREKERVKMTMMTSLRAKVRARRARVRARTSPRAKARVRARTSPRAKERGKVRKDHPRDIPAGNGVEVEEAGTAGMTGVIPAIIVAIMEERAKGKAREKAKDTPIGDSKRQPKEGRVCVEVCRHEGVPYIHFSSTRVEHNLIV